MRFRAFKSPCADELEFFGSKSESHTKAAVTEERDIMRKAYKTRENDAGEILAGSDAYVHEQ